jgi:hypothetical protein
VETRAIFKRGPKMSTVNATAAQSEVVTFSALAVRTGKAVTAHDKLAQHVQNGANAGALIGAGVQRKAAISAIVATGERDTIHALASGNIRPAAAVIVAKMGKAISLMEIDGKAPYSEWLRIGATLKGMVQFTTSGKATGANKALALWQTYTDGASAIRAQREKRITE